MTERCSWFEDKKKDFKEIIISYLSHCLDNIRLKGLHDTLLTLFQDYTLTSLSDIKSE